MNPNANQYANQCAKLLVFILRRGRRNPNANQYANQYAKLIAII
jgi:hypothetical protein